MSVPMLIAPTYSHVAGKLLGIICCHCDFLQQNYIAHIHPYSTPTYIHTCSHSPILHTYIHTYLLTFTHTPHLHTYELPTFTHTPHLHTYGLPTFTHTPHLHTYLLTFTHTPHLHTYIRISNSSKCLDDCAFVSGHPLTKVDW